jgi:hypothetical protein
MTSIRFTYFALSPMEQLFMVFCRQHRRFSHEPDSRIVKLKGDESELFGFRGVSAGMLMVQPV